MKELIKIIILLLVIISLTYCWTKKCEKPDIEHRSWTMVPEGRTTPFTFKCSSGKQFDCIVYPSYYIQSKANGSTATCTGSVYYCQIEIGIKNVATETVFWQAIRNNSDEQKIEVGCLNCSNELLEFNNDTLITKFSSYGKIKLQSLKIIKNKGLTQLTINDTIYERIN